MTKRDLMRDPWVALACASRSGRGVRLTAEQAARLAVDDAIQTAAMNQAAEARYEITIDGRLVKDENVRSWAEIESGD